MLAVAESTDDEAVSSHHEAKDFLLDFLMEGPKPARTCMFEASKAAVSSRTLKRAK
jgi:hypothetical protein